MVSPFDRNTGRNCVCRSAAVGAGDFGLRAIMETPAEQGKRRRMNVPASISFVMGAILIVTGGCIVRKTIYQHLGDGVGLEPDRGTVHMQELFDLTTIIMLGIAVFVIWKLRSVLGTRTGNERPPVDMLRRAEPVTPTAANNSNVVSLGDRLPETPARADDPDRWKGIAEAGTPLPPGSTLSWRQTGPSTRAAFVDGAKAAYEMIVMAFAEGDRKTLKDLLSREVYDGFVAAIADREKRGEKVETTFVSHRQGRHRRRADKAKSAQVTVELPVEADRGDLRQGRRGRRWRAGQGRRRDRHLDFRARRRVARSELEADRHRIRALMPGGRSLAAALAFLLPGDRRRRDASPASPGSQLPGPRRPPWSPIAFADLAGWERDDHAAAFAAFRRDLRRSRRRARCLAARRPLRRTSSRSAAGRSRHRSGKAPQAVLRGQNSGRGASYRRRAGLSASFDGFLTGYYEPEMEGSRIRSGRVPDAGARAARRPRHLRARARRPPGLDPALPAARQDRAGLEPYPDRAAIEDGALAGSGARALFRPRCGRAVHGSGAGLGPHPPARWQRGAPRLCRPQRPSLHVHRQEIVGEGHMPLEEMTLERLKAWLRANPDDASRIMRMNRSYIFFATARAWTPPTARSARPSVPARAAALHRGRPHAVVPTGCRSGSRSTCRSPAASPSRSSV